MRCEDFIIELFCRVDDAMIDEPQHSQAKLAPSEIVTLALVFVIKGVKKRAYYRWLQANWGHLFPSLPERTRLFRLFVTHREWSRQFLASPTVLGVIDTYGIEWIHPIREGRSRDPLGKKGISNKRWIVGGKLCLLLSQIGLVVDWDWDTANVFDTKFHPIIEEFRERMLILADSGFHAKEGDPENLKICARGTWNVRMLVETVFSMLTNLCHFKKMSDRVWDAFEARLAYTMAAFNILVQWHGLQPDEHGFIPLSIAEFVL